jgi:peptidoglycan/LPS O-acetylase OafA/YrhL
MTRILELDGLRAIAILLVISCHYVGFVALTSGLSEFGWLGVDIFFVLSGYLITTILLGMRSKSKPYRTFYARRTIRIFPPYIAVTFAVLILAIISHNRVVLSHRSLISQVLFVQASGGTKAFLDVVRHLRWHVSHLPSLLQGAHHLPLGEHGLALGLANVFPTYWSLSIEEYFYLLWAPVVLRFPRRWIVTIGLLVSIAEIFVRWAAATPLAYFNLFSRFDALLYGALLAILIEHWKKTGVPAGAPRALTSVFLACALIDLFALYSLRPVVGYEIRASPLVLTVVLPLFWIGAACVIGLLVLRSGTNWWFARLLRTPPLQYLGTISYTMYLVHVLAAVIVLKASLALHLPNRFPLLSALVATALTIVIARASWHFLEKPALQWKDRRFATSPHPSEPALN